MGMRVEMQRSTPVFITVLFIIAKIGKQLKCPSVDEWIQQLWGIYTVEYYSAIKKKKTLPLQQHGWTWRILC